MELFSNQAEDFVDILKSKQGFQIIFSPDFRNPPRHFSATPGSGRVGEDVREYSSPVLGRTGPFSATTPPLYLPACSIFGVGQARQPQPRPARHPPSAQRRPPGIGHRENTETAGSLENRPFALNSLLNTAAFGEIARRHRPGALPCLSVFPGIQRNRPIAPESLKSLAAESKRGRPAPSRGGPRVFISNPDFSFPFHKFS